MVDITGSTRMSVNIIRVSCARSITLTLFVSIAIAINVPARKAKRVVVAI